MDAGIEDIVEDKDGFIVSCEPEKFMNLKDAFDAAGLSAVSSDIEMVPDVYVSIDGEQARIFRKLVDILEELDDVQHVWSNEETSEDAVV